MLAKLLKLHIGLAKALRSQTAIGCCPCVVGGFSGKFRGNSHDFGHYSSYRDKGRFGALKSKQDGMNGLFFGSNLF